MKIPPKLKSGDTIAIVATARKISESEISFAKNWLIKQGFQVVLGKTIGLEYKQFAGIDKQRAEDFQAMFGDPNVKAIWCARGGYGTVRIIDLIDFSEFQKNPKWVIGYSDITVLHSHIHNLNVATIHAKMPVDIENASAEAKKTLSVALTKNTLKTTFKSSKNNKSGNAKGTAIGGNLSVLYSLCGSESAIKTDNKILFIEDLDEYLYHIDRMFQNLARNGLLKNLAGLVIGAMTKMHDNEIPFGYSIPEMILELTKNYNYPVVFNAPFGHIPNNRAIIFGKELKLKAEINEVSFIQ